MEDSNSSPAPTRKLTARERAEARRRRILERSKDRMSVVSGTKKIEEISSTKTADDALNTSTDAASESADKTTDTNAATETPTVKEGSGNDQHATADSTTSKGSARLAQMRRRRYIKTAAAAAETTAPSVITESSDKTETEGTTLPSSSAQSNDDSTHSKKEEKESKDNEAGTETVKPSTEGDKKYLGVVKMRRKMLAEKKKASEEAGAAKLSSSKQSASIKKVAKKEKKPKSVISLRPILVELITIICLFLVGFDIGVQNHIVVNQEVQTIHDTFAVQDHGIGAMKLVGGGVPSQLPNDIIKQDPFDLIQDEETEEEEFNDDSKPVGASSTTSPMKEANIDPVFGVDFDELTKGDGIFLSLVRAAVSIHRMLTYIFFTLPMSFISTLFALPKSFLVNPPILFLASVIIRYLGKHVFGGSIPDLDKMLEAEISDNVGMKPKESVAEGIANTNFASMGTNFVKNMVKTNFPKAVLVYTIFSDARSDMFIVFCGFFLGLVLPSDLMGWFGATVTSISEEL